MGTKHYDFNYTFSDTEGISFISYYYNYDGDILIYYDNFNTDTTSLYVDGWCSRWDVQDYSVVLETWLSKSEAQTLRENITPGAVDELYTILGRPTYYDKTWTSNNTLRIVPNIYTRREKDSNTTEGDNTSNLINMRNEVFIYVKNYTEHTVESDIIEVKIEGYISGAQRL